jgi:hypothetical protein
MQISFCRISLVVTSGEVCQPLWPTLFLWLDGNIDTDLVSITVASSEAPASLRRELHRADHSLPIERLEPFIGALYAANFPSPKIAMGADSSDLECRAMMSVSLRTVERKAESAVIEMSGMAGSYRGEDADALQHAMSILLTLAQLPPSHQAWHFLAKK